MAGARDGFASLEAVPRAKPFVGPDQAALAHFLAQMTAEDLGGRSAETD